MDYKDLAARTHLDEKRIKAVMDKDFAALAGANVSMTLKVLERELDMDFSAWREEYELWHKEHMCDSRQPKIAPKVQGCNNNTSKKNTANSKWFFLVIVLLVALGFGIFYKDKILNFLQEFNSNTSEPSKQITQNNPSIEQISNTALKQEVTENLNQTSQANQTDSNNSDLVDTNNTKEQEENLQIEAKLDAQMPAGINEAEIANQQNDINKQESNIKETHTEDEQGEKEQASLDSTILESQQKEENIEEETNRPKEDLSLKKLAILSIIPTKNAWISIKDLSNGKSSSFSIKAPFAIKSPSLIFIGTTGYKLKLGSKYIKHSGRYFIYDESGIKFLSKGEFDRLDKKH